MKDSRCFWTGLLNLTGLLCVIPLEAQPRLTSSVHYEVASIKRSNFADPRSHGIEFLAGGRFRSTGMPFLMILGVAYNIPTQSIESTRLRIKGVPDWMMTEPYDVDAIAEKGTQATATAKQRNERIRLMLQSVLMDRLKLKLHRAMEEMPVYALRVAAHGPATAKAVIAEQECSESAPAFSPVSASGPGCHQFQGGVGRGLRGSAVDMSDLALYASNWSDLPIVDQTGLTGLYKVQTEGWNSTYIDDPSRPTLEDVFEKLGLKLVRTKAAVEVLVIEQAQRPSGN